MFLLKTTAYKHRDKPTIIVRNVPIKVMSKSIILVGVCLFLASFFTIDQAAASIDYQSLQEDALETAFRKITSISGELWDAEQESFFGGAPCLVRNLKWPLATGRIAGKYNISGKGRRHTGIDILSPKGTPIYAVLDGVVEARSNGGKGFRGYGNVVVINHDNKLWSLYSHCSTIDVKVGDRVKQGDVIATVGCTGRATTNHVHFEIRNSKGHPLNPLKYLPKNDFFTVL